jgi:isocitrate dehydrogenase (NAD+)
MSIPRVTLVPGDLIGRDLAPHVVELVAAAGGAIEWELQEAGAETGEGPVPAACIESIRRNGLALKGPIQSPVGEGYESPSVTLRKALGLFAGVRHIRNLDGLVSRYEGVDLVVLRENTEDVYAGLEHEVHPGVVESIKVVTRAATERIAHFAFRYARAQGRKRVAIVHKANIMKKADGLFLSAAREVSLAYPDIETRDVIVDNACMQLVQRPHQFEVLVCGNLYGDILSDLAAGLVGGISAVWGVDRSESVDVFDAIHGKVPHLMGRDVANPLPMLLPAIALLERVGQHEAGQRLQNAVTTVLRAGAIRTVDLGGSARTSEMTAAIRDAMR